jgi:hypothetical protein
VSTENADAGSVEVSTVSRIEAEREEDQRSDVRAILVIFSVAVLMALHFVSGWTF